MQGSCLVPVWQARPRQASAAGRSSPCRGGRSAPLGISHPPPPDSSSTNSTSKSAGWPLSRSCALPCSSASLHPNWGQGSRKRRAPSASRRWPRMQPLQNRPWQNRWPQPGKRTAAGCCALRASSHHFMYVATASGPGTCTFVACETTHCMAQAPCACTQSLSLHEACNSCSWLCFHKTNKNVCLAKPHTTTAWNGASTHITTVSCA
mmetsp:Transcript_11255/g.24245  ORF Transcript_11255/g.24245 Transcript_11255/m.24245 type:complete len:207 (-) Transcript_11255:150-770(-)